MSLLHIFQIQKNRAKKNHQFRDKVNSIISFFRHFFLFLSEKHFFTFDEDCANEIIIILFLNDKFRLLYILYMQMIRFFSLSF